MGDGVEDDLGYLSAEGPNSVVADQVDTTLTAIVNADMEGTYTNGVASG
jgi:hypothetical protein